MHSRDRRPHAATRRRGAARRLPAPRRAGDRRRAARATARTCASRTKRGDSSTPKSCGQLAERHRGRARRRRGHGARAARPRRARSSRAIQRIDPSLARLQELYDGAFYAIEELARELDEYEASVDLDPSRLDDVARRRDLLFRLTKKYGAHARRRHRDRGASRAPSSISSTRRASTSRQLETREREARATLEGERGGADGRCAATRRGAAGARGRRSAAGARHARRPPRRSSCARARDRPRPAPRTSSSASRSTSGTSRVRWRAWRRAASCRA